MGNSWNELNFTAVTYIKQVRDRFAAIFLGNHINKGKITDKFNEIIELL